ncbi:ABC transporter permease [Paenibacillus yanchengensis]|uniref:ABC transporter permease n=1 Tax=Paenibacillus yanchengensis TaxID=2035833 RepID=A0ABW4YQT4_9BACL
MQIGNVVASSVITVKKNWRRGGLKLFLMAIPFIVIVFVFSYIPLFGWIYAFYDYLPGIALSKTEFIGLDNFREMLSDGEMTRVMINTLVLSFLSILSSPLPLVLAVLLNEVKASWFKKLIQTTTTLPNFTSWVIVFSLAFSLFSSEGLINQLLMKAGLINDPLNVLGNERIVWIFQTLLGIWKTIGWSAIIYLAAIAGIDSELYDAAKVDGAGRLKSILHITLPGISSTFFVLLLLAISNMLSAGFEQYLVFYNVMVANKIEVLDLFVYRLGLITNDYSYSTAVGIFKSVVSIVLLFSVNHISRKVRGESII